MSPSGISKLDLKRQNRMQILRSLRQSGPLSRVDLSRNLNLTRAAITIITNEMIDSGILIKKENEVKKDDKRFRGRKKSLIDIEPNYKFVFGVTIYCNQISVGLSNLNGDVLDKHSEHISDEDDIDKIISVILNCIYQIENDSCLSREKVLGVGVCIERYQKIKFEESMETLKDKITKSFGYKVAIDDLVDMIALSDIDFGYTDNLNEKPRNTVFIKYADEVNTAVVFDEEIVKGFSTGIGDIAQMTIDAKKGKSSENKSTCLNDYINTKELKNKINDIYSKGKTPLLFEKIQEFGGDPAESAIYDANFFLDESIKNIVRDFSEKIAVMVRNSIIIFNPDKVVFCGKVFNNLAFRECFLDSLKLYLEPKETELLSISNLKTSATYLAGCCMAIRKFFIEQGGIIDD